MFSDNLKMLRLASGLTQCELAQKIGVSQGTIYFWEKNINSPSSTYIQKLMNVFDVTFEELLDYDIPKAKMIKENSSNIIDHNDEMKKDADNCLPMLENPYACSSSLSDINLIKNGADSCLDTNSSNYYANLNPQMHFANFSSPNFHSDNSINDIDTDNIKPSDLVRLISSMSNEKIRMAYKMLKVICEFDVNTKNL